MITVTVTLTFPANGISIAVDQEPVNLAASGDPDVEWSLDAASYSLGWRFANKGVDIKAPASVFKNNNGSSNGKKHGWTSLHFDGKTYKYTINVENPTNGAALTWDPTIKN
jgi:hypothetical protein